MATTFTRGWSRRAFLLTSSRHLPFAAALAAASTINPYPLVGFNVRTRGDGRSGGEALHALYAMIEFIWSNVHSVPVSPILHYQLYRDDFYTKCRHNI